MLVIRLLVLSSVLVISACGGSGGSEAGDSVNTSSSSNSGNSAEQSSTEQGNTDQTATQQDTSEQTDPVNTTEEQNDLASDDLIDSGFDFRAVISVDLQLDVSAVSSSKSYVSLCHYKDVASKSLNYEDCLLRGSAEMGVFEGAFEAAPHFQQLGLVVWFIDTSIKPLQYEVSRMEMDMGQVNITAVN